MKIRILVAIVLIIAVTAVAFWSSGCYFSDAETIYDNTFTAGTWATPTPTPTPTPNNNPLTEGGRLVGG